MSENGLPLLGNVTPAEADSVRAAIGIPAHVVQAKGHGHGGTAMALAPLAHVLYQRSLRHNPHNPHWLGRDRLVLSAGHASLLLYVQLFLTGYGLQLDELAKSRTLDSRTPGHPELGHTPGIEMTTGPLGQGVASAVGMALAARRERAVFAPDSDLLSPTIWAIAGDGCMQEGVSGEASSLAGTLGLDNLVVIWDDNNVTIDSTGEAAFSEDVRARYAAYGWRVLEIDDASNLDEIEKVLSEARSRDGRPTFVAIRSVIGAPSIEFSGKPAAHSGGFGEEEVSAIKTALGFAPDTPLDALVTDDGLAFARGALARGQVFEDEWNASLACWKASQPEAARAWHAFRNPDAAAALSALNEIEVPPVGTASATRKLNSVALKVLQNVSSLWGGSADLAGSTGVEVPGSAVTASNPGGEFIRFGIREHAMAAILNGIAIQGPWRPFASTYLVFSDYMRPSIRLAALMQLPVIYVFTHDSVAVGEDGPTHQPVEQIASLRTVPGLDVVRPADAAEVVSVWKRLITLSTGPTALVFSRQDVPVLPERDDLDAKVAHGGYVAWQHGDGLDLALIATGSEVSLALEAAEALAAEGVGVRVVSMPSVEWFAASDAAYRETVLPTSIAARVAVEAGRGDGWYRWVGLDGEVVSVEEFGESGSGAQVMARRGITLDTVLGAARRALAK
ncbi:transketolase [Salinibacterium sp. TMP30]|uniref:transketolase family protein n=1 Tax=Salinibacterium sp. TMP30 TaxID=3138237 RepID=UPI0031395355